MNVQTAFDKAKAQNRAALIGYLPLGYPDVPGSIEAMQTMVAAGVDAVEIGIPYSDPVIDGPVIQNASQHALERGVRTKDVFAAVEAVVSAGAPALVMTYWNVIEQYGPEAFAADLSAAGGAGLIAPDLLPEEAQDWIAATDKHELDRVFLVAPSSTDERVAETAAACRGFVYATAVMGVTGARTQMSNAAPQLVPRVRAVTDLPVGVGLGVSTAEQAHAVAQYADGVIVGSALVRCLTEADSLQAGLVELRTLTSALAAGVRR
ncbi:MAG: tryptophan synthase subunit alpha [Corynebacteriales bacterium]|nr:tryptophan synthase subunit alpha [Mycobacteriales bacterium]